jgi:O-antigen/teichoic acid export membrane protein
MTRLANIVSGKISQFFLGTLSSAANVALFEVPTRVAETGSVILNRILQVLFPKFSAMDRVRDIDRIREMYVSVLQIQLAISIPLMMMIILEGPYFLEIWINKEFSDSASVVITLVAITYFLSSLTNLPVFTAMSFNLPGIISKYSLIRMGITAIVVYPLVSTYGLMGAAWTLFLSELQGLFLVYESSRRALQLNVFRVLAKPISIHMALMLLIWLLYETAYRGSDWYHPLGVLAILPVYAGAALLLGATSDRDNQRILRLVSLWH